MIKYSYTILYVADVEKSIRFYEEAFGFQRKFITPEADYGELLTGDTTLSFITKTLGNANLKNGFLESRLSEKPFGIELGFATPDVDSVIKQVILSGGTLLEEARQKPWGQTIAYVRDLDGFLIEICTPMS
ncbi:VOC family protein [Pedobacter sp. HDW13]|uniref:VOC family protein n=1 Tax=unclassified Pedobacter TaxID=2628915 RepID=UPI000F5A8373|nr:MULTISPECIES: VOC family protein [unclassified Pedobacter]QIL41560.1 VOC family protein [Pedobacter sp. HDW13]RQO77865.1 glyoxalase [Pedobacter sp. KBW01]